jgi:hypothetical protein
MPRQSTIWRSFSEQSYSSKFNQNNSIIFITYNEIIALSAQSEDIS